MTVAEFNDLVAEVEVFRTKISERLDGEFDDKSDKWKETDAGSSAFEMVEKWQEEVQTIENCEGVEIDLEIPEIAEALGELPEDSE